MMIIEVPMSSRFSGAAHGTAALPCASQQPLHKPLHGWFFRLMPTTPLHCSVPASTSRSLGSTPQSIHVRISRSRLVICHVANASQNIIYKAQRTLASSQFCSAGTGPSCHGAHSETNCSGCRHQLVAVGQESALPSRAERSAWQLAHQLLKDAWEVLPLSSAAWAIKMPDLPAKELSQLYVWCGGARPSACLWGVSTRNDEQRSAQSQCAGFTSPGWVRKTKASPKLLHFQSWPDADNIHCAPAAHGSHWLYALSLLVLFFQNLK